MSNVRYKDGTFISYTPLVAMTAGDVIRKGGQCYIADQDMIAGRTYGLQKTGTYKVDKAVGAWAEGDSIFYDATAEKFTTVSAGNTYAGYALEAAESADTEGVLALGERVPAAHVATAIAEEESSVSESSASGT